MASRNIPPGELLTSLCAGAQSLVLAAPYIKADALTRVLAGVERTASIVCVTRWNPYDLALGVSDPQCRSIVRALGGSFRLHPSLHAKFYRINDVALIGSANLTSSAMGWSPHPNLEILCPVGDDFDISAFQEELLGDTREVSDEEFNLWEAAAELSTRNYISSAFRQPQLGSWRPMTRDPRNLELSYFGEEDEIASSDEQSAAFRDIQTLLVPLDLSSDDLRSWVSSCLLAAPFTNAVIQYSEMEGMPSVYGILAQKFNLDLTDARRDMETVQSWLAYLAPGTLQRKLR